MFDNLHTDSSPESEYEVGSFNSELLNEIHETEQSTCENMDALDSFMISTEDNDQEKATLELQNFIRNWTIKHRLQNNAVSDLLSYLK